MSIMDKLSVAEKSMLLAYIENYGFAEGGGGTVKTSIEHLLRFWDTNKSKYLFQMFGNELILNREIVYKKSVEDLKDELDNVLYGWEHRDTPAYNFTKRFYDFGWDNRFAFPRDVESAWSNLISSYTLATNVYEGETVSVTTPDGKEIKIAHGCRVTRVIGKLAKAFGLDEGFEEFRIAHSIVLNQKELRGNLCLSIHPMDYFTMSDNWNDWSSCMSWQENGCYRMGTVEMMNSPMVIVAYLTSSNEMDVPHGTWNSKKWRELYIVNDSIITNVKAYPYKNENLTKEVIAWLKDLAERAGLSKYDEVPFFWNYNYQNECSRLYDNGLNIRLETHFMYNDFDSDAGQWSYLGEGFRDGEWINYSGESICMCCGETNRYFDGEGALVCEDCDEIVRCEDCGERIYDDDECYTIDGQTLCYGCYERHTVDCLYSEETHMKYNCVEIFVAWDKDAPLEGRELRYDRGWGARGRRKLEAEDIAVVDNTHFFIYDDLLDEALSEFAKDGAYETFSQRWDRDIYVIRMSNVTEEFAKAAGYSTLEGFIADLKSRGEMEVWQQASSQYLIEKIVL